MAMAFSCICILLGYLIGVNLGTGKFHPQDRATDRLGDLAHQTVAECGQLRFPDQASGGFWTQFNQSKGHPINHATHVGFSMPGPSRSNTVSLSGREFFAKVVSEARPERVSCAVGVGHRCEGLVLPRTTCSRSPRPPRSAIVAVGVGRLNARCLRPGLLPPPCLWPSGFRGPHAGTASNVVGVGSDDPDPIAPVRGAKVSSGYTVVPSIIPERSEPPEHDVQSARSKGWDVFDDDPRRPELVDDPAVLVP